MIYKKTIVTATLSKDFQKAEVTFEVEFQEDDNIENALNAIKENVVLEARSTLEKILEVREEPVSHSQPIKRFSNPIIDADHQPTQAQINFLQRNNMKIPKTRAAASEIIRQEIERQKYKK